MSSWDKRLGESINCVKREDEGDPGPSSPYTTQAGPSPAKGQPDFENSPFPAAMLAVAHGDSPETRRVLYESMLKTWFLVPTREPVADAPGLHDIQETTAAMFSLEHDPNGLLVAVAFTDEEALRNWQKTIPWIALQGNAFFQAVASTEAEEIVINPYEPENPESKMIRPGGIVKRWEFEELAEGRIPEGNSSKQVVEPQSVLVTTPKEMPAPEMFNAISEVARTLPEIAGMYFGQVIYPDGEPHWTIAVEFAAMRSDKHLNRMMTALVKAAQRVFPANIAADFMLASTSLGQSIKTTGKKFY